jgi:heme exporter protein A
MTAYQGTETNAGSLLEVAGVTRHYNGVPILRGVDLTVSRGEIVVLYGVNGAGKTTLLRVLATLLHPHKGTLRLNSEDYAEERVLVRKSLMYCGHGTQLYDDMDALENLRFSLALYGESPTGADLEGVLRRVNLWRFRNLPTGQYSAGMKRRLSLGRAMLRRPALLLLDEPYTSLDTAGIDLVNVFIADFAADGGAVVMSSHSKELVAPLNHRTVWLHNGVLQAEAPHVA